MGDPREAPKHFLHGNLSRRTLLGAVGGSLLAPAIAACASDSSSEYRKTQATAYANTSVKPTPTLDTAEKTIQTRVAQTVTAERTQPPPTQAPRPQPTRPAPTPERITGNPEQQAKLSAVNAWLASLDASKPSQITGANIIIKVTQMAQVGNRPISADDIVGGKLGPDSDLIKISWSAPDIIYTYPNIGEAEIKTIRTKTDQSQSNQLTSADRANSLAWKGNVVVTFVARYKVAERGQTPKGPFSPWKDDSIKISVTGGSNSWQTQMTKGEYASNFKGVELPTNILIEAERCASNKSEPWCRP